MAFWKRLRRKPPIIYPPFEPYQQWRLSVVLNEICQRAQIPLKNLNTRHIDQELLHGFSVTCTQNANEAVQDLASIYLFDVASFDTNLNFIKRGGAPVATIEKSELIADNTNNIQFNRKDNLTIPYKLNLEYQDTKGTTQTNKQSSTRAQALRNQSEKSFATSVVMDASQAVQTVEKLHKIAVEEAKGDVSFKLPLNYIYLTVGDIIILDGQRVRIEKVELNNGFQSYIAVYDGTSSYQSNAEGNNPITIEPPKEMPESDAIIYALDLPLLNSNTDVLGLYFVAISDGDHFAGAIIEFEQQEFYRLQKATIGGELLEPLNKHSIYYPDHHNIIAVKLSKPSDTLQSVTFEDVLNGANLAYLDGELLQFTTAQKIDDLTWHLSGLVRGLRGSNCKKHNKGALFIMLDNVGFAELDLQDIDQDLTFNTKINGFDDAVKLTISYKGLNMLEQKPTLTSIKQQNNKLHISWQGRAKFGSGKRAYLSDWFAGYQIKLNNQELTTQKNTAILDYEKGKLTIKQLNFFNDKGEFLEVYI